MVIPTTLLTIASSALVAYGFARFNFPFKKQLFAILIATLMLPNSVIIIPRYVLFNKFGWVDSYMPFWVPALLACYPFFIYQLIQFMRGIPRDLDESACIDGCGTFRIFWQILLPLKKPALFSAGLFQFLWTYNDYFNSLIFINSVKNTPSRWRCAFPLMRKVLWCGAALWPWPAWRFCRWFSSSLPHRNILWKALQPPA